jgi:hypothetical protein
MSRAQREERFQELRQRLNIAADPDTMPRVGAPIEVPFEEMEEWEWLRNDLGYN